jgi:hypothetical protein
MNDYRYGDYAIYIGKKNIKVKRRPVFGMDGTSYIAFLDGPNGRVEDYRLDEAHRMRSILMKYP